MVDHCEGNSVNGDEVNISNDGNFYCKGGDLGQNEDEEYMKRISELTVDDIRGIEFDDEEAACSFYKSYAKCNGFVVRKDEVDHDFKGNIVMRQLVCNREGERKKKHLMRVDRVRQPRALTRTRCPARLRVHYSFKTGKWRVAVFEEKHNHELTPLKFVHLIPAYRGQKCGHSELGFCKKDLYNHIDKEKRAVIEDGDAFAALCIPCSHIFCSMKNEHVNEFPASLVCKRWTKSTKIDFVQRINSEEQGSEKRTLLQLGALAGACNRLFEVCSQRFSEFSENYQEIYNVTIKIEKKGDGNCKVKCPSNVVGDPTVVKTKGAPRKKKGMKLKRRCSHCKRRGHNLRRCPRLVEPDHLYEVDEDEEDLDVESNDDTTHFKDVTSAGDNVNLNRNSEQKVEVSQCDVKKTNIKHNKMTQNGIYNFDSQRTSYNEMGIGCAHVKKEGEKPTMMNGVFSVQYPYSLMNGQSNHGVPIFPQFPSIYNYQAYTQVSPWSGTNVGPFDTPFMGVLEQMDRQAKNAANIERK
ncbi:FAR1 DNA-binding domain [Sesbania bispinosa]|nr:FAR1 DNA-binding domain [Sesbania bispinosa]